MAANSWSRYPKIPESTSSWPASTVGTNEYEYIVTEKLHGANFSVILDSNGDAAFASRSGVLANDDNFYGFRSQGLDGCIASQARRLHELLVRDGVCADDSIVTVYGELCGGRYPHSAVKPVSGLGPVQCGCWYAPYLCFVAFDVSVHGQALPAASRPRFIDFCAAREAATEAGFLFTRPLLQGNLSLCLDFPVRFRSQLPVTIGLPELEDDPNWAEGVIVRPAKEPAVSDGRRFVKIKIPEFSEKQYANAGWKASRNGCAAAVCKGSGMSWSEEVANLRYEMLAAINEQRLASVISKVGHPDVADRGACKKLLNDFKMDVIEALVNDGLLTGSGQLSTSHPQLQEELEIDSRKLVARAIWRHSEAISVPHGPA